MKTKKGYGYEALGLVLNEDDFSAFKENYIRLSPEMFENCISQDEKYERMADWIDCGETFISGDGDGDFEISCVDGCYKCDGLRFFPIFSGDENILDGHHPQYYNGKKLYLIEASVQCDPLEVFHGKFYRDPKDIIKEMKCKTTGYLPDDFPYAEKIGLLSYVFYYVV